MTFGSAEKGVFISNYTSKNKRTFVYICHVVYFLTCREKYIFYDNIYSVLYRQKACGLYL
jgi:hypothetical protein